MSTSEKDIKLLEVKKQIEEILQQNKAALVPVTLISGDKVFSRVDVVSVDSQNTENNS